MRKGTRPPSPRQVHLDRIRGEVEVIGDDRALLGHLEALTELQPWERVEIDRASQRLHRHGRAFLGPQRRVLQEIHDRRLGVKDA